VDASVNAGRLYTSASNHGIVNVGGVAREHTAYATALGNILSYNLAGNRSKVSAEAGGKVEAYALSELSISADSGAMVFYKGDAKVQSVVSGDALVRKVG
jgi:hypothetical protein